MKKSLLIPIQVEALFLSKPTPVREGLADFTRLPYNDGQHDSNPDTAYLSEEILTPPFQDENLMMPAGIHLHWYLPGALTKSYQAGTKHLLPAVPDRWLVTRFRQGNPEKNWLVESDFLSEEAFDNGMIRCHVPFYNGNPRSKNKPYRFLGRVTPLDASWSRQQPADGDRIDHLTATGYEPQPGITGYGEPTFAAFYPHCSSVFGFHDGEINAIDPIEGLAYQVLGFYSRSGKDYLSEFIAYFIKQQQTRKPANARQFNDGLYQAINQEFQYEFDAATALLEPTDPPQATLLADDVVLPIQSFFSARVEINSAVPKAVMSYQVAVGNTGTEALSALLASQVNGDKALIESQLEAVQFAAKLTNRNLDLGAKFIEARHEKGFGTLAGETHWTVVVRSTDGVKTDHEPDETTKKIVSAEDLHRLNSLQQQYERARLDLDTRQRHLYADWNKYMLCAYPPQDNQDVYPDIDEAKNFIERFSMDAVSQLSQIIGELRNEVAFPAGADTFASQFVEQKNRVLALIDAANTDVELIKSHREYALKLVAGPRYWRPNDPVVLVAQQGNSNAGVPEGGRDPRAVLSCVVIGPSASFDADNLDAAGLLFLQQTATTFFQNKQFALSAWNANPWRPFLLEWEVELFPAVTDGNLWATDRNFTPNFIGVNYQLGQTDTDFSPRKAYHTTDASETLYSGLSILTPNAGIKLTAELQTHLTTWVKTDFTARFFALIGAPAADRNDTGLLRNLFNFNGWLHSLSQPTSPLPDTTGADLERDMGRWWTTNLSALMNWYLTDTTGAAGTLPDAIRNLMESYRWLPGWECLAQSLGGFNDALLMLKQSRQLEIADPIGFPEYQDFTDRVREAVGRQSRTVPQPLNDFMPIRSGHMEIRALRLVDSFGQTVDIPGLDQGVVVSEPLRDPAAPQKVLFRPRLSQAARLNLRWLSAKHPTSETNPNPDTSPICGWLLPNYLDNSLAFYDEYGQALGSITPNPDMPWQSAPGDPYPITVGQIENDHLRRVAQYVYNQQLISVTALGSPGTLPGGSGTSNTFLAQFLDVIESALETIEPENFAQHADLALLMGRPLAVVRVSLDLQLLGEPAVHQGWQVFINQLQGQPVETDDFDLVNFPVRLGERHQLNDGLVGYWPETADGHIGQTFYTSVGAPVAHPNIVAYQDGGEPLTTPVNVNALAQSYTLLMDPRGKLHATSGILPTKVIDIPATQFAKALRTIEVCFQVAPLLSDRGKTKISLPLEPGYAWSWLEQIAPATWQEIARQPVIARAVLEEKLPTPADLWRRLLKADWLQPTTGQTTTAAVTPKDQRPPVTDPVLTTELLAQVDLVFDGHALHLQPMDLTASLSSPQVIREGWLKLSPEPVSE